MGSVTYAEEYYKNKRDLARKNADVKHYASKGRRFKGSMIPVVAGVGTDALAHWVLNGD